MINIHLHMNTKLNSITSNITNMDMKQEEMTTVRDACPDLSGEDLHSLGDLLLPALSLQNRVKLQPQRAVEVLAILRGLFKLP